MRLVLDFLRVPAMWIGVYYALSIALLVAGIKGTYDGLKWWPLAVGMSLVSVCCWLPANTIAYTDTSISIAARTSAVVGSCVRISL